MSYYKTSKNCYQMIKAHKTSNYCYSITKQNKSLYRVKSSWSNATIYSYSYWKCSQRYAIKIRNSQKYDEQLNLTRHSNKNNLFERPKKLKEFQFHQNLKIEFTKNDKFLRIKYFAHPWFHLEKTEFNDLNVDELFDF